jgi:hypothetical protein
MSNQSHTPAQLPSCTAFHATRQVASGTYAQVAIALKDYNRAHPDALVLIFEDATGNQIDFDLRGSDEEIAGRLRKRFALPEPDAPRAPGRPRLGVLAREITLLPRHWEWLAAQPGGASATLRRLVEEARRSAPPDGARLRLLHERTYRFMSAIAGDLPGFEEASRALFAHNMPRFMDLIAGWPMDVRAHLVRLSRDDQLPTTATQALRDGT